MLTMVKDKERGDNNVKTQLTIEQHKKRYTILRRALGFYAHEPNYERRFVDLSTVLENDWGSKAQAAIRRARDIKPKQQ